MQQILVYVNQSVDVFFANRSNFSILEFKK